MTDAVYINEQTNKDCMDVAYKKHLLFPGNCGFRWMEISLYPYPNLNPSTMPYPKSLFVGHPSFMFSHLSPQAVDQDRTKSVSYTIVQGDTGFFEIDSSTGQIVTRVGLDYENQQQYEFVVSTQEAQGEERSQYSATVTVNVLVSSVVFRDHFFTSMNHVLHLS